MFMATNGIDYSSEFNYEEMIERYKNNPDTFNYTDPKVEFDPKFDRPITGIYFEDATNIMGSDKNDMMNRVKDDAINVPLVKVNTTIINENKLDYLKIMYDGFLPSIHLSVKDDNKTITSNDNYGMNNQINVVITVPINGYYKKISLPFYITNMEYYNDYISYDAILKINSLNNSCVKGITHNSKKDLTTYELCYEIALENKLGFACTEDCDEIDDAMPRLMQGQNYLEFIKNQITISGNDDSVFDAWVDLFGYLVLVNVKGVMNSDIEPNDLCIFNMGNGNSNVQGGPEVKPFLSLRILTNKEFDNIPHNMFFRKIENIIDNSEIYDNGTSNKNFYLMSPCNKNIIGDKQFDIVENSLDGMENADKYNFLRMNFVGIDFSENNILNQKAKNESYMNKIRARKIKIQLENYNLGLERGTLVWVNFIDYDRNTIKMNNYKENLEDKEYADIDEGIEDNATGKPNPYIPGMYYIDSMEFEYASENRKIIQYLYLIKKSFSTNSLNRINK